MNRVPLTPVYVLHRRPYRNTSLLVDFFSEQHGRVSVVARSARGPKSRFRGALQPFTPMLAAWSGQTELKTLNALELVGSPHPLPAKALLCGFYLNELLIRLLQCYDPYPRLYKLYQESLVNLAKLGGIEQALRLFEKRLLHELGYGLLLDCEAQSGNAIMDQHFYRYHPELGFMRSSEENAMAHLFSGKSLLDLHHEQLENEQSLKDAKRLMRMALNLHLGDRALASRELFG